MRLSRTNLGLALALGLLVAASIALERPALESAADAPLFAGIERSRVARIRIEAPAASGPSARGVELVRNERGWTVAELYGFPALGWAVDQLIGRVAALRAAERVGERALSHERFGVGALGRRVVLTEPGGALLAAFVQGVSPGDAGEHELELASGATYVRPADGERVFRASGLALVEAEPLRWIDSRLVVLAPGAPRTLGATWVDAAGVRQRVDLEPGAAGTWRDPARERRSVAESAVQAVLEAAALVVATDVVAREPRREHGLAPEPALVLELDGVALSVGASAPSGERYATSGRWSAPFVVCVPAQSAAALESALDELAAALARSARGGAVGPGGAGVPWR